MERVLELEITEDLCGYTIKQILYQYYKMSSRLITKIKYNDGLYINKCLQSVNTVLQQGDRLEIIIPSERSENIEPTPMNIDIVYEDEDIITINKPPNLLVHPCQASYQNTLANGVVYYWQTKGANYVFRPVHRLDKDTSGLILVAKNQYAHHQLSRQIVEGCLIRKYIAIVHGHITQQQGTIELPISRKPGSIIERRVYDEGKTAITHYTVIRRVKAFTVVELALETGRTHQIRVHMSYIGHPLVGDWLYGKEEKNIISRHALHSYYLAFKHPISSRSIILERNMPYDMQSLL